MMDQSRWYYNFLVSAVKDEFPDLKERRSLSYYTVRDLLSRYEYVEEPDGTRYYQSTEKGETIHPPWWEKPHSRLPRGVAKKLSQNINSALSNYHNKNIHDFDLKHRGKKKTSQTEFVLFEDQNFPLFLREISSSYWFTNRQGKKQRSTFRELFKATTPRGVEILYDKIKDHYYFCYPVDYDFYPENDRRNDSQARFISRGKERVISLDPGIRKFLMGYDPGGRVVAIGEGASKELIPMLCEADKTKDPRLWRKIRDRVSELHWKTIAYLTSNYDCIVIPEFRVSGMVRGRRLSRMTKRLLYMFSFHSFLEKLRFRCSNTKTSLYIVGEEYTSKTCTRCGEINDVGGSEEYRCQKCGLVIDRDVNGSRNILIKNVK
jgi:transposase